MTSRRTRSFTPTNRKKKPMYQAKTGQQPPKAMQSALAAFQTAQVEQLAHNVASRGALLPHNLTDEQRRAVKAMVSRVNPSL
jgi:hypothetical protein